MFTPGSVVVVDSVEEVEVELDEELLVDCATEDPVVCPDAGGVEPPARKRNRPATVAPAASATRQPAITARRRALARRSPTLMYIDRRSSFIGPVRTLADAACTRLQDGTKPA